MQAVYITTSPSLRPGISERRLRFLARGLLAAKFGARSGSSRELSVALVGDARIRRLNRLYRDKDRPTDVLSFSQREGAPLGEDSLLGDIVISIPTAKRQAREHGLSLEEEVLKLLVHGFCHLLGYDHQTDREERLMQAEERRLAAKVSTRLRRSPKGTRPNHRDGSGRLRSRGRGRA